jgi:hypothetical protein
VFCQTWRDHASGYIAASLIGVAVRARDLQSFLASRFFRARPDAQSLADYDRKLARLMMKIVPVLANCAIRVGLLF